MIYQARVMALGGEIEEEVDLRLGGVELKCFAAVCPLPVQLNHVYPVHLELVILDEYVIAESSNQSEPAFSRIDDGFGYLVSGWLDGARLRVGELTFEDEVLQRDFGHLNGKFLSLRIDRINVDFDVSV